MGKRQENLKEILETVSDIHSVSEIHKPKMEDIKCSGLHREVQKVYWSLGGCLDTVPIRVGPWDLNIGGTAVELDENLHFNRYRNITLDSNLYRELQSFPLDIYRKQCLVHERDCLKAGSLWAEMDKSKLRESVWKALISRRSFNWWGTKMEATSIL